MSKFKLLVVPYVIVLTLSGCASINLGEVHSDASKIIIVDHRAEADKQYKAATPGNAIQLFGDNSFNTPPLNYLGYQLSLKSGNSAAKELVVDKFRVADHLPKRMAATTAAGAVGALGALGYTGSIQLPHPENADSIICFAEGTFDKEIFSEWTAEQYELSTTSMTIQSDASFMKAVTTCLEKLAAKIMQGSK